MCQEIFRNVHAKTHDFSIPNRLKSILPMTHHSSKKERPKGNDATICRRKKFPGAFPPYRWGDSQGVYQIGIIVPEYSRK